MLQMKRISIGKCICLFKNVAFK